MLVVLERLMYADMDSWMTPDADLLREAEVRLGLADGLLWDSTDVELLRGMQRIIKKHAPAGDLHQKRRR